MGAPLLLHQSVCTMPTLLLHQPWIAPNENFIALKGQSSGLRMDLHSIATPSGMLVCPLTRDVWWEESGLCPRRANSRGQWCCLSPQCSKAGVGGGRTAEPGMAHHQRQALPECELWPLKMRGAGQGLLPTMCLLPMMHVMHSACVMSQVCVVCVMSLV